jgi:hypothetical protein
MNALRVVAIHEVRELVLEVAAIPERHESEKFPPDGADQAFNEWMREWNVGHDLDLWGANS